VPTRTATPTPIVLDDPRLTALEQQGYQRVDLAGFSVKATTSGMTFGGPDTEALVPQHVSGTLAYLQYAHPETQDCVLVFARAMDSGYSVLDAISASGLSPRLKNVLSPTREYGPTPLFCTPLGWGDANQNGIPDLAVTFLWANQYTGSEAHLFEVQSDHTVKDLFADLPGIVSPWDYDPTDPLVYVFDDQWALHDCIYPPMSVVWVYAWREGRYVDVTEELDISRYLAGLQDQIEQSFGSAFNPYLLIESLTRLLLYYDRIGQRQTGWEVYQSLTDLEHWPGTDAESVAWLQSDVAHFGQQVQSGAAFTPNDYCGEYGP